MSTQANDLPSPRLRALKAALDAGGSAALDTFWREVARMGAPLVEPDGGDHSLVTFLWHGNDGTRNVVLVEGFAGFEYADNALSRLSGTDVWHKTYRLPNDFRGTYRVSPNDSLVAYEDIEDWEERTSGWQPDPLNPRRRTWPADPETPGDREQVVSVAELAGAPPQPWMSPQPGTPCGRMELHRFRSEVLNNERRVWVHTPPGYQETGEPPGVLVVLDGFVFTVALSAPAMIDHLMALGSIPPLLTVLVDTPDRRREYACYPPFSHFLSRELMPWLRGTYNVATGPSRTVIAGASFGGLAAGHTALHHSELFGNVVLISGSVWWSPKGEEEPEWLSRQFATRPRLPLRFYLTVGRLETEPRDTYAPSQIMANRHLRDILQAREYEVHWAEYTGGHDLIWLVPALAEGLITLVGTDKR